MKRIMLLVALIPLVVFAAYMSQESSSNGATPVTILNAPGASTSRTAFEYSIKLANTGSTSVTCTLQKAQSASTNVLEEQIILLAGESYFNEWRTTLDATTDTLEFVGDAASGSQVDITVNYRDESQ